MEKIFNFMDKLEHIEKEYGSLGTIVGLLIMCVATMTTLIGIIFLLKFNLSVINWVIESLWFK